MNYGARKQNFTGIGLVTLIHLAVGYMLITSLSRTIIDRAPRPTDVTFVAEPPRPLPRDVAPPEPRIVSVPTTAYVPPRDIEIQVPVDSQPSFDSRTTIPTPPSDLGTPNDHGVGSTIAAAVRKEFRPAHRVDPIYPRVAQREGMGGRVIARLHVTPEGTVSQVQIMSASSRVFEREVTRALSQWKFRPEPVGFIGEYEIAFNLTE
jgi:protein TonB